MERPDRFDPYRVLGVPPGATIDEVKAAYRRLAKRHHPDAAGPDQLARFLTVQAAYESIAASHGAAMRARGTATRDDGAAPRADGGATHPPGGSPRGSGRAGRDWYTAAREAARARSRAGGGQGTGTRARAGGKGSADPAAGGSRGTGQGPGADDARLDLAWRRKASLGSTTYDDAVEDPPAWDGSAWYGPASGTYWTVNPREYADPRKHGPGYLGRTWEWTGDRWTPVTPDERPAPVASPSRGAGGNDDPPPSPTPGPGAAGRAARVAAAIRSALGGSRSRDHRVG